MATVQNFTTTSQVPARHVDHDRTVDLQPQPGNWAMMIAGAIVPLGLAVAATVATMLADSERVAITAWVSVAVVGAASVIAAAAASRRRQVHVDHDVTASRPERTHVRTRDND